MSNRLSFNDWAMQLAQITAKRATCKRRNVGAILIDVHNRVVGTGYNGVASGMIHCIDQKIGDPASCPSATEKSGVGLDGCYAIHAEQNALLQCKNIYEIESCYCTTSPCITCVKLLLNTSCKNIYFLEDYVQSSSQKLWLSAGRSWHKLL